MAGHLWMSRREGERKSVFDEAKAGRLMECPGFDDDLSRVQHCLNYTCDAGRVTLGWRGLPVNSKRQLEEFVTRAGYLTRDDE